MADAERVPSGRARDAAAAVRVLVPRRGPAAPLRALRAIAASACKEEIALVVAGFGIWYAVSHRRRLEPAGRSRSLGVAWAAIAIGVVIPHYQRRRGVRLLRPLQRGRRVGRGIVKTTFTHPAANRRRRVRAGETCTTCWSSSLRSPALCLLAPLVLVAALPELAINLLSSTTTQTSIHFHYTAGLIPPLVIAAVFGAKRLDAGRFRSRWSSSLAALVGNYRLGPIPGWRHVPGGERFQATAARVTEHDRDRGARAEAHPGRRGRQRDQHAWRTPVRAPPRAQLPVPPGRDLDRG